MRVLIADDSSEKIGVISKIIREIGLTDLQIEHSLDLNNTRAKLHDNFFDLLILDLNMPMDIGSTVSMENGIEFISEIRDNRIIKKPTDIIVLSAFDDSVKAFKGKVENAGFVALQYDPLERDWQETIKSRIEYLSLCEEQCDKVVRKPACDVFIITAVDIETKAINDLSEEWNPVMVEGDITVYYRAELKGKRKTVNIIRAQQSEMGMTAAAYLCSKAIMNFHPQYIIMPGIIAGLDPKKTKVGDVIVAQDIWNYSVGKYEENKDGSTLFFPDARHQQMEVSLFETIRANDYTGKINLLKKSFPHSAEYPNEIGIHFGQVACGSSVVASRELVIENVLQHARKSIGLDMESYAIYYVSSCMNTKALVIKAVSDLANREKSDNDQSFAAYNSAQFTKTIITDLLY